MSNMDMAVAIGTFLLIWVVIAFVASLFIKLGQRVWRRLKSKFDPDEMK